MSDYAFKTITELRSMLDSGLYSSQELATSALDEAAKCDEEFDIFSSLLPRDLILNKAQKLDLIQRDGRQKGKLHGVPYTLKDVFSVAGTYTTSGLVDCRKEAKSSAAIVENLEREGALLIGKTRCSPIAATIVGLNNNQGTPRNPWKKEHYIPGGSSSGSAVSVACGMVPFSIGTDTGGSVRVPAALCGVVGVCPSVAAIDREGMSPLAPTFDAVGYFVRTMRDASLLFSVLGRIKPSRLAREIDSTSLRVGFISASGGESCIISSVRDLAASLEGSGINVVSLEDDAFSDLYGIISEISLIAAEAYPIYRQVIEDDSSDWVIHWLRRARAYQESDVRSAYERVEKLSAFISDKYSDIDVFLLPTTLTTARPLTACSDKISHTEVSSLLSKNTQIVKLMQWCSISVPCGKSREGLPIGALICSRKGREDLAFSVAQTCENIVSKQEFFRPPEFLTKPAITN